MELGIKNGTVATYQRTRGLREWTGGPFMEPRILLQIASRVEAVSAVISVLMTLRPCLLFILQLCATRTKFQAKTLR